ncbi:DAD family protein [Xylariales sp. AK1849]|nr:DAD family protein [Xylariales sp. AK1849]
MAKKPASGAAATATNPPTTTATAQPTNTPAKKSAPVSSSSSSTSRNSQRWDQIALNIADYYQKNTPQRTKLIDVFMAFLVAVGGLQFLYCILAGNYPFNAFLSGFGATVGQFVLTASLRIQTTEANKSDFPAVSPERAFADYVVGSLILHFFCINFIN